MRPVILLVLVVYRAIPNECFWLNIVHATIRIRGNSALKNLKHFLKFLLIFELYFPIRDLAYM
jgi:hypothetical protein